MRRALGRPDPRAFPVEAFAFGPCPGRWRQGWSVPPMNAALFERLGWPFGVIAAPAFHHSQDHTPFRSRRAAAVLAQREG